MKIATPVSILSAFALSACTGATIVGSDSVVSYNDAYDRIEPFLDEIDDFTATALTSTPPESSASMTGVFTVEPAGFTVGDDIAGQIDMEANFASGTVSGTMSDFVEVDFLDFATPIDGSVNYTGTINIGTGVLDDIDATGTGTLTNSANTTYSVTADMDGDFFRRPNGDLGAGGFVDVTATTGSSTLYYDGAYIVAE